MNLTQRAQSLRLVSMITDEFRSCRECKLISSKGNFVRLVKNCTNEILKDLGLFRNFSNTTNYSFNGRDIWKIFFFINGKIKIDERKFNIALTKNRIINFSFNV